MKKSILVKGPALSRSGYGEQTRFALRALRAYEEYFDIHLMNVPWGHTGHISALNPERDWVEACARDTALKAQQTQDKLQFDISLQVTIPGEFEAIAPVNVGYTAGIETTKVAAPWIEKSNNFMQRIITVSQHGKEVFEKTKYTATDEQGRQHPNWGLTTPIAAVNYAAKTVEPSPVEIELTTDKNFLVVAQWGPRKNLENTIRWFVEEFKDDADVGLVLKATTVSESIRDREHTTKRLEQLLASIGEERKCKVYLIHGELSEGQLTWLYQHSTMKALINIAHGEGFGLPMFEAAYNGLPLVTITWGGQLDFICKENKKGKRVPRVCRVDYDIEKIQKHAVWPGVIEADSMWAYAKEASYKRAIRSILDKEGHFKKEAGILQKHILEVFTEQNQYKQFAELVYGSPVNALEVEELPKISIITSVYDGDEFIRPFMENICAQSIFEEKCELILINANSPGNEEEVINEYLDKYPDNIVYKKLDEDPGIYGVWNMAVKMATGEFLTNANLDDRKSPRSLERHAKELYLNEGVDLVYADMMITDVPNETFETNSSSMRKYNFPEFSFENLKMVNMPHACPMWRKEYHEKYGYFDAKYRSAGDWECWLRGASQGSVFIKIPEVLGLYYFNPKGISTNPENFSWKREEEQEIYAKYENMEL